MKILNASFDNDGIARIEVLSDSNNCYMVCIDGDTLKTWCDCPRWVYKKEQCKHIRFVLENVNLSGLRRLENMDVLKSECVTIDTLLGGGFPYGMVVSVTAEPNIGKTKLGLQLAVANIKKTGKNSIIIETEGESLDDQFVILEKFGKRYGVDKNTLKAKIKFYQPIGDTKEYGIQKLMKLLGYDLGLSLSKGGKFSVDFAQTKLGLDEKVLQNSSFILLDSITTPIKESVGSETQNLPARAAIVQRLYGRLYQIAKTYNMLIVVNHHTSLNPVMPFGKDLGKIYGGQPVLYNSKYAIQILPSTSELKRKYYQGFEEEARRVRLIRHPYIVADGKMYNVRLKRDYGFCDL